jgi:para-aminobenzoate synthetase component 2
MIKYASQIKKPLLGVCLGHQGIGVAYGATVNRAPELLHGKTSVITHNNSGVLKDIPNNFTATRYHSLAIDEESLPEEIEITARSESGLVMAIRHKTLPIHGVQFHPESVLTEHGYQMLGNWLVECGDSGARKRSEGLSPVVSR